jgi:hypothetical protein
MLKESDNPSSISVLYDTTTPNYVRHGTKYHLLWRIAFKSPHVMMHCKVTFYFIVFLRLHEVFTFVWIKPNVALSNKTSCRMKYNPCFTVLTWTLKIPHPLDRIHSVQEKGYTARWHFISLFLYGYMKSLPLFESNQMLH